MGKILSIIYRSLLSSSALLYPCFMHLLGVIQCHFLEAEVRKQHGTPGRHYQRVTPAFCALAAMLSSQGQIQGGGSRGSGPPLFVDM